MLSVIIHSGEIKTSYLVRGVNTHLTCDSANHCVVVTREDFNVHTMLVELFDSHSG